MRRYYQWRNAVDIISGGYPGEEHGVINGVTDWQDTTSMTGSTTAQYYYRDSDLFSNANSSRVVVTLTESWTASINQRNFLTITLRSTIDSIVRDSIRGNPGTVGRNIFVRRGRTSTTNVWTKSNDAINTAHTILQGPLVLDEYTFTLEPGQNLYRGSLYFRNNTVGHDSDPPPSVYVDEMWIGAEFRNPLPVDYRPGATLQSVQKYGNIRTSSAWMTHNRTNKAAHVLADPDNDTWQEMRTVGYPDGKGNPPLLSRGTDDNSWFNQAEVGKY